MNTVLEQIEHEEAQDLLHSICRALPAVCELFWWVLIGWLLYLP